MKDWIHLQDAGIAKFGISSKDVVVIASDCTFKSGTKPMKRFEAATKFDLHTLWDQQEVKVQVTGQIGDFDFLEKGKKNQEAF